MSAPSNLRPLHGSYSTLAEAVKATGNLCVIDFYADYCPPCRRLLGVLPDIASEFPDVNFFKVDVMSNQELAGRFSVGSIPCIKFVKPEGNEVKVHATVVGFDPDGIKNKIRQLK